MKTSCPSRPRSPRACGSASRSTSSSWSSPTACASTSTSSSTSVPTSAARRSSARSSPAASPSTASTSKPSYKVRKNDQLHVEMPEPTHEIPVPEDIPIDILFQDEWLAVVNKPPDMVVHPAKGNWSGTLVNALQWHFRDQLSTENGQLRAGIVHRLDKDTSGVILVAKDDAHAPRTGDAVRDAQGVQGVRGDRRGRTRPRLGLHRGRAQDAPARPAADDRLNRPGREARAELLRGAGTLPRASRW